MFEVSHRECVETGVGEALVQNRHREERFQEHSRGEEGAGELFLQLRGGGGGEDPDPEGYRRGRGWNRSHNNSNHTCCDFCCHYSRNR